MTAYFLSWALTAYIMVSKYHSVLKGMWGYLKNLLYEKARCFSNTNAAVGENVEAKFWLRVHADKALILPSPHEPDFKVTKERLADEKQFFRKDSS